ANPKNAADKGWDITWGTSMPADAAELRKALKCDPQGATWTDLPGDNETKPINCLTWFMAFAFCIADGGRLPTEAEWDYATAGGAQQRVYAWSDPPNSTGIDPSYAVYMSSGPGNAGSFPKGNGLFHQSDLGGNILEWVIDWLYTPSYVDPCT